MIIKDYQKDLMIDPKEDFNYFSLEGATNILKRIKKPPSDEGEKYYGTAKRKSSESEVFVKHGTGRVMVNGEPINEYFGDVYHRVEALKPLIFSETAGQYDLEFNVVGGGLHSQSECMAYALAKALMKINPEYR
jgi:small subunit ribosomal protein S9